MCDRSRLFAAAVNEAAAGGFGKLDLLVNNAAIFVSSPLDQITVDEWMRVCDQYTRAVSVCA